VAVRVVAMGGELRGSDDKKMRLADRVGGAALRPRTEFDREPGEF
jgi:hypothetical protein